MKLKKSETRVTTLNLLFVVKGSSGQKSHRLLELLYCDLSIAWNHPNPVELSRSFLMQPPIKNNFFFDEFYQKLQKPLELDLMLSRRRYTLDRV